MNWISTTLWDLIKPTRGERGGGRGATQTLRVAPRSDPVEIAIRRRVAASSTATLVSPDKRRAKSGNGGKPTMQDRYDALVEEMKSKYDVRIRKWRKSSSGVARLITYHNGKQVRLVESPYPRGPMSCAIFMHEIGHHAIGLGVYKPRCLEEYHVWVWALREMRERGFNVTPAVEKRFHDSMKYAVRKARRRGLAAVPGELYSFI